MYFDGTVIVKTSKKPYFSTAVVFCFFSFFFFLKQDEIEFLLWG